MVRGTCGAHSLGHVLCDIVDSVTYDVVVKGVLVHHFYLHHGVRAEWNSEVEGIIPVGILSSKLAWLCALVLSSEIDFAVGGLYDVGVTILPKSSVSWVRLASMGLTQTCILNIQLLDRS